MTKKHDIMWFDTLDSTNDEARRHIDDIDNLSVVAAGVQTKGRGQGDHIWLSPKGINLLFSIVLKFSIGQMHAKDSFRISAAASESMVEFLRLHGIDSWIKPPNDIYVGDRKICGTLIENSVRGSWVTYSIIGIGLNVNQQNFDVTLPNPTSMVLETDKEAYDIHVCLNEFLNILEKHIPLLTGNDICIHKEF